jgi:hypothetical protein
MEDLKVIQIKDTTQTTTLIRVGEASGDLPRHLMSGEKECGYLVQGRKIEPWYWNSIKDKEGFRHIELAYLPLLPFTEISRSLRKDALVRLTELARAFMLLPSGFLRPSAGMVETWRVFFLLDEGVLILPEQLSQIILHSVSEEAMELHVKRYGRPNMEYPFGLCHQFTQFLYLAATGFAPYQPKDVREDRFRHIPLSLIPTHLDQSVSNWIDATLAMESRRQRETVSAAYSAEDNLAWWLEQTKDFTWTPSASIPHLDDAGTSVKEFLDQQKKRADRRRFWRKRGALVASIALAGILAISIVGNVVAEALRPPYTAGMSAPEVIEEFHSAQNELDLSKMGASFARGVENPYEMEVSSLFVNSKVRQAYESFDSVIRADRWIGEGRPPIPESAIIYGVVDLQITELDGNRYRADYRMLFPAEREPEAHAAFINVVERSTEFLLENSKGYWRIKEIKDLRSNIVDTLRVETIGRSGNQGTE